MVTAYIDEICIKQAVQSMHESNGMLIGSHDLKDHVQPPLIGMESGWLHKYPSIC